MASDSAKITDQVAIKKGTVDETGKVKNTFFFPSLGKSIEADTYEEALKKIEEK